MIFENRYFPRVTIDNEDSISLQEFCKWNDIEIVEAHDIMEVNSSILELSQKLLLGYMRYSDLMTFLSVALTKKEKHLRYILKPPYTTSKLDCEYVLNLFVNSNILTDVSYSSISKSYWIETNLENEYSMRDILNIGLCSYIVSLRNSYSCIKYSVKINISGNEEYASVVLLCENKLIIIAIENAIGLESEISSHLKQLERLKKKIFKARQVFCDIEDIYIVTPYVSRLLPSTPKIITIDQIKDIEIHLAD